MQAEMVDLQAAIRHEGMRVAVVFEGRDTAGKGGTIQRLSAELNPRAYRVVALGTPTEREGGQWYFQRYVAHLPSAGELVLFDRSWYNRAGVERVMGFCTEDQAQDFLRAVPDLERMLVSDGLILVKYWLEVSAEVAGGALPGARVRPHQALEALPHRPGGAREVRRLQRRARRDARAHRHPRGALVHR